MASFVVTRAWKFDPEDRARWVHNTLVFLVPVAIVFLGEIVKIIPQDWQYGAFALYILNLITDLIRKWANANTYRK